MAGTFTIDGDTATISFIYTAETEKAQAVIENYAERSYDQFPILDENGHVVLFDDLTAQQKLDVADKKIRYHILRTARAHLVAGAIQQATDTANADDSIDLN